ESLDVSYNGLGLLGRGQSRPQGIEGSYVLVLRARALDDIIVEEHAALGVPQIAIDERLSLLRALGPLLRFGRLSQQLADGFHVRLGLVEQAVQADGGIVMGAAAEVAKTEGDVEAGLAHGAVALVVVGSVLIGCGILARLLHSLVLLASLEG